MVTITDAGTPPTRADRLIFNEPRAGLIQRIVQPLPVGPLIGDLDGVPSSSSMLVVRGLASGSRMAFSWAPTVLVSLPCRCHMPSRRCFSSR